MLRSVMNPRLVTACLAAGLASLSCLAQEEPKCEGPLTEARTISLVEAGVTERRVVALLVACGMKFELSAEGRSKLKQLGVSEDAFNAIEWLEKWESLGSSVSPVDATKNRMKIAGTWTATFSDSLMNGTLQMNIAESDDGTVRGTYSSSLGGGGTLFGTVWAAEGKLEIRQNIEGCPGITKAILRKIGDSFAGEYIGFDCIGPHLNGKFTVSAGTSVPPGQGGKPALVYGSVVELRLVRSVHVLVGPEHAAEKIVIESLLRRKGIPVSDDPIKADAVLEYALSQGRPYLAATRFISLQNTIRIIWFCRPDPATPGASGVAEHCANEFVRVYAEAHGN